MIERGIAKIISYIFHPMYMPTLGIFILFNSGSHISLLNTQAQTFIYLITFVSTCIAPLLFLPFFLYRNIVKNIRMETIKERIYPLSLTLIFYFFLYYIIKSLPLSNFIISFIFGSFISVLILFIITLKWKISAHMTGIGGVLGLIIGLSIKLSVNLQLFIICVFIISGMLGYSRLRLNEHTPLQVCCGYMLGFLCVFLSIIFY